MLVLGDDAGFAFDAIPALKAGLQELRGREWKILRLGECGGRRDYTPEGSERATEADTTIGGHAVAFHRSVYDQILGEVPAESAEMEGWLKTQHNMDRYYAFNLTEGNCDLPGLIGARANVKAAKAHPSQQLQPA